MTAGITHRSDWYLGNFTDLTGVASHEDMTHRPPALKFTHPLPYGAILHDDGVQFVVFSRNATAMRVLLYDRVEDTEPSELIDFDPTLNRWGDIWSIFCPGMAPGQLYHLQADGPYEPEKGFLFKPNARLIDPYAKALAGCFQPAEEGIIRPPKCVVIDDDKFDWQGDRHIRRSLAETVIYELHVRGFTRSRSSHVEHPGTYLGIIEKIPYLKSLGVTAVELMPVHEFPIRDCLGQKLKRPNYWGYDSMAFFGPHRGYAAGDTPGCQTTEFKEMVRALHQAGIEVILDVVFNHTCEGNQDGPVLSFKGLENHVYYMLNGDGGTYRNYTGCGNTLNGNHPIVREMIFHCLRYWVHNYHIDGFRFDLASILSRDRNGNIIPNPPVVESIAEDPLLADTKIIAEAWDAAGAYQVGTFANLRWAEWNGRYRDDVRRYWRGDPHIGPCLATRLAGSSDLYQPGGRSPYHSINFITSHDGFTLNDLVSYNHKHNDANGEENRDGDNNNHSCNYGVEGPTRRKAVQQMRLRHIKNLLTTLLTSQGVPMMVMGDECRRTQRGNNNAYCQDNAVSWFDWRMPKRNKGLRRFCNALITFRVMEPTLRQEYFLTGASRREDGIPDVSWFNADGVSMDWSSGDCGMAVLLGAVPPENSLEKRNHHVLMLCHSGCEPRTFTIPEIARALPFRLFVDTAATSPQDVYPDLDGPAMSPTGLVHVAANSMVIFVAPDVTT